MHGHYKKNDEVIDRKLFDEVVKVDGWQGDN